MNRTHVVIGLLAFALMLTGCGQPQPPTAQPESPTPAPSLLQEGVLISELLPGVAGINNNLEFVELYNAGPEAVDLSGWSLWYRMDDQKPETLVYAWQGRADIPGHGHYLLSRTGEDVGVLGDSEFDLPLFEKRGGLALRDAGGETVDSLVWGEGPSDYRAGPPVSAPEPGSSLERLPGSDAGNAMSTGDNGADFAQNPNPRPQNSGDTATPRPEGELLLRLDAPATIGPGSEWTCHVQVLNQTGDSATGTRVFVPIPEGFEPVSSPPGASQTGTWFEWVLPDIAEGATMDGDFVLRSPWTYLSTLIRGAYVEAPDGRYRSYGTLLPLAVEGGSIPVGAARTLKGQRVTVEGVATMFTDGFYAGTTGTKFYLEDETGGIQVYCPGGKGLVQVAVGDRVRVTGDIDIYRDAVEIIPATYPDDVEMLEGGGQAPVAGAVSLAEANSDETLLGRLILAEGVATRIEEFSYSFEVDLIDEDGHLLVVYIDKDTGVTAEPLELGHRYRVTGINEIYDGQRQIQPRFQTDLARVYAAEMLLDISARYSALPGETLEYSLTAYNYTDDPLTDVRITLVPPARGLTGIELSEAGGWEGDMAVWVIPEVAGRGGSVTVSLTALVADDAPDRIEIPAATVTANEWPKPATTDPVVTFVGTSVPIWAVQGPGSASPYARDEVTVEGVVTGEFPEMFGFWIQELESDDDPSTSAGLFILVEDSPLPARQGDWVRLSGRVRELSGQTLVDLQTPDDLRVLSSDNPLPEPVELDPPVDEAEAVAYYEPLEGMVVQVTGPAVAIGPTSRYGETPLVLADRGIERIMRGDPRGLLIFIDDGSQTTHYDQSTLPVALKTGDRVEGIVGPLAYTYENYKVEVLAAPRITPDDRPLPSLEPVGPDEFSVATFNVENLFDTYDPHPSDPPIPSTPQYRLDLTKTAAAIEAMAAPVIVAMQEVENLEILKDLAEEPNLAPYGYVPVLIEGTDSRGIDNGYLVRSDLATLEGASARVAPDGLTSRPPLLITVTLHLEGGDSSLYVLNNHFTSMSGGELPTEPRRKAQAAWNVQVVQNLLDGQPDAQVIVLGDLNSFYRSPPMDVFREAGLHHVYELVEPDIPYTYIYEGDSETLDHIWVTPTAYEHLVRVEALHISADYPLPLPDDASARHASDHDPLVAVFSLR